MDQNNIWNVFSTEGYLTHSFPMHSFYSAWKHQKTCFQEVEKGALRTN